QRQEGREVWRGGARKSRATFGKRPSGQSDALPTFSRGLRTRGVSRPSSSKPVELHDASLPEGRYGLPRRRGRSARSVQPGTRKARSPTPEGRGRREAVVDQSAPAG